MLGGCLAVGSEAGALVPTMLLTFSPEKTSWLPSPAPQEPPELEANVSNRAPPPLTPHSTQKAVRPSPAISHLRSSRTP